MYVHIDMYLLLPKRPQKETTAVGHKSYKTLCEPVASNIFIIDLFA